MKETAVFMYEAAIHRYIFYLGWWCNVDCKWKCCSVRILFTNVTLPYMSHIVGFLKLTVKPIVAHGVKADWLSSVHWKDILDVHCTDHVTLAVYRCIEEDNFDCKFQVCLISSSLFETSAVGVPTCHRFRLQCNFSILLLPLYMFVVTVSKTLR